METRRSREKLTPIFMSRQQRRELSPPRGAPEHHHEALRSLSLRGTSGARIPRNENSRVDLNRGKTSNIQHRTQNADVSEDSRCHSMFGVGCSMFDVPLGSCGASFRFCARIGTMNRLTSTALRATSPPTTGSRM